MRRRRRHLEIQLFPFLSVLLCTMGALVLLLVALDREARQAREAEARRAVVDQAARQAAQEQAAHLEARARADEFERRLAELRIDLRREQRLAHALHQQINEAAGLTTARAKEAAAARSHAARLRQELETLKETLAADQVILKQHSGTQAAQERARAVADAALTQVKTQIEQLEQTLAKVQAATRASHGRAVFSLVPYQGRLGAVRKPIYAECVNGQLVFRPDGQTFFLSNLKHDTRLAEEVSRRSAALGGANTAAPYLLLLIRPSGLLGYYLVPTALKGTGIDFGYELIDEDLALDFTTPLEQLPAHVLQALPPAWPEETGRRPAKPAAHSGGPDVIAVHDPRRIAVNGEGSNVRPPVVLLPPNQTAADAEGRPHGTHPSRPPPLPDKSHPIATTDTKPPPQHDLSAVSPRASGEKPPHFAPPAKPQHGGQQGEGPEAADATLRAKPPVRPVPLRAEPREWEIVVECTSTGVIVWPGETVLPHARLSGAENSLRLLLEAMITDRRKRQPDVQPQLKFLIHPDGMRSCYLAAAAVQLLGLPTRHDQLSEEAARARLSRRGEGHVP